MIRPLDPRQILYSGIRTYRSPNHSRPCVCGSDRGPGVKAAGALHSPIKQAEAPICLRQSVPTSSHGLLAPKHSRPCRSAQHPAPGCHGNGDDAAAAGRPHQRCDSQQHAANHVQLHRCVLLKAGQRPGAQVQLGFCLEAAGQKARTMLQLPRDSGGARQAPACGERFAVRLHCGYHSGHCRQTLHIRLIRLASLVHV